MSDSAGSLQHVAVPLRRPPRRPVASAGARTAERREPRPRAEGPPPRPPRRRPAPADGAGARRRERLPRRCPRRTPTAWAAGSGRPPTPARSCSTWRRSRTPSASCSTPTRSTGWPGSARSTWRPTASSTPRCASPRSCRRRRGLAIEDVVEAMVDGFEEGGRRRPRPARPIRVGALLCAMRQADRWDEVAGLVVRYRDDGVVGFDLAGPEIGFPPDRMPVGDRAARRRARAPHHPRGRGRRHREHPGRPGRRPRGAAGPRGADRRRGGRRTAPLGPLAQRVLDEQVHARGRAVVQRADRRLPVAGRAPGRPAAPPGLRRHAQHRQPADERGVGHQRVRRRGDARSAGPGTTSQTVTERALGARPSCRDADRARLLDRRRPAGVRRPAPDGVTRPPSPAGIAGAIVAANLGVPAHRPVILPDGLSGHERIRADPARSILSATIASEDARHLRRPPFPRDALRAVNGAPPRMSVVHPVSFESNDDRSHHP